jgi:hypothetical protein
MLVVLPLISFRLMRAGGVDTAMASMGYSQPTTSSCSTDEHMHRVVEFDCDIKYLRASRSAHISHWKDEGNVKKTLGAVCIYISIFPVFLCVRACACMPLSKLPILPTDWSKF